MENERSAVITIGGKEYELILTTRATKEIARRYGGLENLGEKLMKSENFEMALDEIIWLLTLLANQSILIHNLKNKDAPQELLTEEDVELLTSPLDLGRTKTPSPRRCSRERHGMWRVRRKPPQKTRKSGKHGRDVYPAFVLRNSADGHGRGGILADAHRPVSGFMGLSQAVSRHGKAETDLFH